MKEPLIRPDNPEDMEKLEEAARQAGISYKVIHRIKNEYQLKRSRYYLGSDHLYREMVYYIRQYPEYIRLLDIAAEDCPSSRMDIPARSNQVSQPTERQALRHISLQECEHRIHIINDALLTIPDQYRDGVFEHVVYQTDYCDKLYYYANINTWKRWTQKFIYEVAVRRGYGPIIEQLRQF